MSLQNILKVNNNELYCKKLIAGEVEVGIITIDDVFAHNITSDNLITDLIFSKSNDGEQVMDISGDAQDAIIVNKSILPPTDNGVNLGQNGLKFGQLHVSQVYGPNTSINMINSLSGANNTAPLQLQNGFVVVGSNQTAFNKFFEYTSPAPIQVGGPFGNISIVNYKATRIGSMVFLEIAFNRQTATNSPAIITIQNFDATFLANFLPTTDAYFQIPIQVSASTVTECVGVMTTAGVIQIGEYFSTAGVATSTAFTLGDAVGLPIANGSYFTIVYHI